MRKAAKNEFKKKLFKLINKVGYDKTMGNVRMQANIKLVTKWTEQYCAEALIAKPHFTSRTISDANFVAIKL